MGRDGVEGQKVRSDRVGDDPNMFGIVAERRSRWQKNV